MEDKALRIGLVLSGGMGKGAYQIGALKAIGEIFTPSQFQYVSASSIGALNTYAFLTDHLDLAQSMWENANKDNDRCFITSVLKSDFLKDSIHNIISDKPIPTTYYVPLLDLSNRNLEYYDFSLVPQEALEDYLTASVAMPYYNKGVKIDGKTLYDGAVVDNIPIYPVFKHELDLIICIYFDNVHYIFENYNLDQKILKLTFQDPTKLANSVNIRHEAVMYMLQEGYSKTKSVLSAIFQDGFEPDAIYKRIQEHNLAYQQKKVRITGDVVVTNTNKLFQKLLRRKNIIDRKPDA